MTATVWALIALVIVVTTAGPAVIIWVARRAGRDAETGKVRDGEGSDTL